mgnify:FL=1
MYMNVYFNLGKRCNNNHSDDNINGIVEIYWFAFRLCFIFLQVYCTLFCLSWNQSSKCFTSYVDNYFITGLNVTLATLIPGHCCWWFSSCMHICLVGWSHGRLVARKILQLRHRYKTCARIWKLLALYHADSKMKCCLFRGSFKQYLSNYKSWFTL